MKKYFKAMWMLLVISFVCSCASQHLPVEWQYEKEAIHIHLEADSQLNFSGGMAHTLMICVYQLRDPNSFNQLTEDNDGLRKLLKCNLFDNSVISSKRLIIYPGQYSNHVLDRSEGSKHVAIVAGYYLIEKERIMELIDIPVIVEKKGWIKRWIKRTKIKKPGPLNIELVLGREQIQKLEVK